MASPVTKDLRSASVDRETKNNTASLQSEESTTDIRLSTDPSEGDAIAIRRESRGVGPNAFEGVTAPNQAVSVPTTNLDTSGVQPRTGGLVPEKPCAASTELAISLSPRQQRDNVSPEPRNGQNAEQGSNGPPDNSLVIAPANPTLPSSEPHTLSLNDLQPAQATPWAIVARVFARNPVRTWKNFQDAGILLELYVTDSPEICIRATLFNSAVDKFSAITVPGTTCYFSGGRVRRAFAVNNGCVELSFGKECNIRIASTPLSVLPLIRCLPLASLASIQGTATTISVVHAVGGLKRVTTRKGKSVDKRDLLLVDASDTSMVCTTWGQLAQAIGEIVEGTVVLVRQGLVSDYNNSRSLSIGAGSDILQDPFLDRAEELRRWYAGLSSEHTFRGLSPSV